MALPRPNLFGTLAQENRFVLLFISLVVFMVASPLVKSLQNIEMTFWSNAIMAFLFMLAAIFAVSKSRSSKIIGALFTILIAALQVVQLFAEQTATLMLFHILTVAYLGYVIILVTGYVFAQQHINANKTFASLCVYILLGFVWALIYSFLEILQPGSFLMSFVEANNSWQMRFGQGQSVIPLYYSLVTMTTLGYGDIIPVTDSARMFAAMQAVIGQLYIAVLVARLVAVYTSTPKQT
ncbi:MAG: ion channel [Gammaproteobacteria bacterium]|jgi:hypothetical protein